MFDFTRAFDFGKTIVNKIWMDKGKKERITLDKQEMLNTFNLALARMQQDGDMAEYQDDQDRRKDIRESGWLSRQVRPVIALTFHFFVWGVILLEEAEVIAVRLGVVLFEWASIKVTIGMAYFLIVLFYFMTKGLKDYFISKSPMPTLR